MSDAVIVGIIAAVASIIAAILTSKSTQNKVSQELATSDAVQNEKIENLRKSVEKHNNFAQKIPVIEEKISVANHRISDLERKVG